MEWSWNPLVDPSECRAEMLHRDPAAPVAFAQRIRSDATFHANIVAGYREWIGYFRRCALNPVLFRQDPSRIDRFLVALSIDAESICPGEFPPLYEAIADIGDIASATVDTRRAIIKQEIVMTASRTQKRPLA